MDEIARNHSAGATVVHQSCFKKLEVPLSTEPLSEEFKQKWILPFYKINLETESEKFESLLQEVHSELDEALIVKLLSIPDWRPRLVGAYFAAITRMISLEDHIGKLLLRSDVCYAATGYCLALARFESSGARRYFEEYLEYYLKQPELWFDQGEVMAALGYVDLTKHIEASRNRFMNSWNSFIANKPNWNLQISDELFSSRMAAIERIAMAVTADNKKRDYDATN